MSIDRPLRLFLFTDSLDVGGTERFVVRLCEHLDRKRFAVELGVFDADGPLAKFIPADVPVTAFPAPSTRRPFKWLAMVRRMKRHLQEKQIDIVFTNHLHANLVVGWAARKAGVPLVVGLRGWQVADRPRDRMMLVAAARKADRVIANSRAILAVGGLADRLPLAKQRVIYNGLPPVDVEKYRRIRAHTRSQVGLPANRPLILCVARLAAEKGHATLLEAAARLQERGTEFVLALAGEGPLYKDLLDQMHRRRLYNTVFFLGAVDDCRPLYGAADAFVLPSVMESLPTALLEAMQFGLPCVATTVGGVGEVVSDKRDGLLVPASDAEALAEALGFVLGDRERAAALGARAAETVAKRFTLERMIAAVQDELLAVAEARRDVRHLRHP
ncbi:MAG: glycosyltransferase [Myxococcales bacterium]|nr:MAG: glycosyltransferase [Myxococcales bacterium]